MNVRCREHVRRTHEVGLGSWEGAWPDRAGLEGGPYSELPGLGFGLKHHLSPGPVPAFSLPDCPHLRRRKIIAPLSQKQEC